VSANLLEIRRSWTRTRLGARVFQVCFAIPAASIAVYATVLSGETNTWQTATLCWLLTGLVIWLIARIASMIERCEREANQNEGPRVALPVKRRRAALLRASLGIEERLAHLEQVIVRQHRFVSDVAHELRTPLTAQSVVGESVLARQAVTAAQLREVIISMLEESKHMKRLIEGLLDLTRASLTNVAEQGVSRQPVALDLSVLARDCVESLRVLAEEKQQSIEVSATTEVLADADLTMVRQALLNVVHNAIEHCPEGTRIQLDTVCCPTNEAQIRVQDNGPGIPLEDQPRVFERFYRGAGTSRQRSLGLGLSIAKAVLCSQGGGIELRSAPGEGCCFLLTLPLAARRYR
jgi:two-component system, OmpR family, sensor kinase